MTKRREHELTEREFEDFLEGRSGVARGYDRLRDVEPPQALDRAVLEQARLAVSASRRRPSFWSHWSSRLAVAAVVVMAVAVTLQLRPGPEPIPRAVEEAAPGKAWPGDDSAAPAAAVDEGAPAGSRDAYARRAGPREPGDAAREANALEQGEGRQRAAMREGAASAPRTTVVLEAPAPPLEQMAAGVSPEVQSTMRKSRLLLAYDLHRAAESARGPRLGEDESARGPSAVARTDELEGTVGYYLPDISDLQADEAGPDLPVAEAPGAPEFAGQDSQASRPSLAAKSGDPARPAWREHPDDWLTLVDALLGAGREEEARRELAELVEAWPDHPVDPRFEPWLPGPAPEEATR